MKFIHTYLHAHYTKYGHAESTCKYILCCTHNHDITSKERESTQGKELHVDMFSITVRLRNVHDEIHPHPHTCTLCQI